MTLLLYSLFYGPLIFIVSIFKGLNPKLKKGFELRKKRNGVYPWLNYPTGSRPIWVHCSSGEYEYAKPVIRAIKRKHPQQKILVTYFSPSVEKSLKESKDIDFFCPTPWDTIAHWRRFIKHHQPRALLISRTDLWPGMVQQAKTYKIPSLLFSKTYNIDKSEWKNTIATQLMKKLDDIFCVTEDDRQALYNQLRPYQNIHAAGDTRYDQCLHRILLGSPLKPLNNFFRPIFVAGSTWPADEQVLIPLIKNKIADVSFIIAPHEPSKNYVKVLTNKLDARQIPWQLYSETSSWDPHSVLIIDQVGILADLYGWGNYAFVGGSMNRSVHSVMEPLAHGLLTFVGPRHRNNREALIFQNEKIKGTAPVQVVKNVQDFGKVFNFVVPNWKPEHKLDLRLRFQEKAGASEIVLKWVENHCFKRT